MYTAWGNTVGNNTFFHIEVPGWRTAAMYTSKYNCVQKSGQQVCVQVGVPFFTILITLSAGKVAGIEFDPDGSCAQDTRCATSTELCLDNAICGVDASSCVTNSKTMCTNVTSGVSCFDCNLKVRSVPDLM